MKLIILDRDGVINEDSPHYIKHPDEWIPIPGSLQAIAKLKRAGWTVAIASNQSGLARGLFDMTTLADIHHKLRRELSQVGGSVDAIFVCPHGPDDACHCRKPLPGLFLDIARRFDVSLASVPSVGDSIRDLQAAHAAGCGQTWLVKTGNGNRTFQQDGLPPGTQCEADLAAVVDRILMEH